MSEARVAGTPADPTPNLDRRSLLRNAAAVGLVALPGAGLLSACATSGSGDSGTSGGGKKTATNPLGVKEDAPLDVVIFNGGYGDKYATEAHEPLYKKEFPKATVKHEAVTDVGKTLQPRFSSGTSVPDVVDNSGSGLMDFGALVADGQMADLTPLWDAPSVDDPNKKVRDIVVPGTVDTGSFNGKPFVLYYVSTVFGLWYSGKLFKDKGWTVPTTWDDFLKLLDDIKKAGLTPFGYAGANAAYYMWNVILTSAAKIGGPDVLKAIDNLEDGAWTAPAVKQAATAWAEVGAKYTDKAFLGLKHTDVQLQQNQYKVALYPSGDWLPNEQSKDTPSDFQYQMMPTPSVTSSDKLPANAVRATAGEGFFVPAHAPNKAGGLEYLRQMLSKKGANEFTKLTKSPAVTVGSAEGVDLGPGVNSSQAALKAAGSNVFNIFFDGWYAELDKECRTATNELFFNGGTADAFCTRMQKKADAIKADSSVTKFHR
ncbi:carbohydrate ABC transporter, N-acetylglucosamine/diacetylchitobiose-binding protein [Planosporangium thailandense]|uniref:Carbohydrate ABC transporter, N-acetylglucosamine/diacetylchitobiose-binding protein n=1 Tax=Planosporangium thailandense TaxID=765197 RepID=A0ABX0XWB4_9ACTN|nr:N-acetylglucosamine/diacetylchitobiose ABC transporter substrate-binding protein [Planosporangium thailandense]NJC70348.1 carbohydrate ABC transporter, N-acetylglucosamine/diacetylchitobiose-binding protein [Planosporangium thailandense]